MPLNNPALLFLEEYQPTENVTIEKVITAYANFLVWEAGNFSLPISLDRILERFDLKAIAIPLIGQRGALHEDHIFTNQYDFVTVQNFSQAHELVELLYLAIGELDPKWISYEELKRFLDDKEFWCEFGAARIVLPKNYFLQYVKLLGFSLETAQRVACLCSLSFSSVARRLVETTNSQAALIYFVPNKANLMRVERYFASPTLDEYIYVGTSVDDRSTMKLAYLSENGTIRKGMDYLEITDTPGIFNVESVRTTHGEISKVVSLVKFDVRGKAPQFFQ